MSDAVCGPSNALQDLRKNASVDRTLQQDRLATQQPQGHGFRSQTPRDGILDPEFAAFEAGYDINPLEYTAQHPANYGAPAQHREAAPPSANWASDFQRLNIAGPAQPQMQGPPSANWASDFQRLKIAGPAQPQMQGPPAYKQVSYREWQEEFMRQQNRSQQASAHLQNHPIANRGYLPALTPNYSMGNAFALQRQASQAEPARQVTPAQQYDEAAFAAAFQQAQADMESQEIETAQSTEEYWWEQEAEKITGTPVTDATDESDAPVYEQNEPAQQSEPVTIRIGSDNINDSQNRVHNADALAHTAGELLNGISHEQSDKFKQSNFLALMRRIRDREVEVQGDEFREVGNNM
ncbi:uncharacterized protein N7483_012173 [Penicillium malachiteum]|uniref:uncharacterized protein n=1 Tax=Penicillium malachiteum TaxID=1324776 RepID=UPI002546F06E|nr:uncharacterized protein N7483_012173 [Penicillium malachiteum]KAJ5714992.1 hypothetical protein N7483_012173 [Penicillium malachiteum]